MKITSSTHTKILFFTFLSLGIKIIYLIYKYNYAFVENDYVRVNPDEYGYLIRAVDGHLDISFGQHWLYDFVNAIGASAFHNVNSAYAILCVFNIFLSLILPYLLLPVIRSFSNNNDNYNKIFWGSAVLLLLMPSAVWLAVSNMKDMLLAALNLSFISLIILLSEIDRYSRRIIVYILLFVDGFLIFSVRNYLAAILFIALGMQLFVRSKHKTILLLSLLLIGFIIIYFDAMENVFLFIQNRVNWIYDPDAAEIVNQQIAEVGENPFRVNYAFTDMVLQLGRFYFGPFPTLTADIWENVILSVQSGVMLFFLIPIIISFRKLLSHSHNIFFVTYIILIALFYSIAAQYSGPRQRFATIDILNVLFIVRFYYVERKQIIQRFMIPSILIGCALNITFILFTSRSAL